RTFANRRSAGRNGAVGRPRFIGKSQPCGHRPVKRASVERFRRRGQLRSRGESLSDPGEKRAITMLNKVPEITLAFWVIKIMSTTVGETGADYLAVHVGLGTAMTDGIMTVLLLAALLLQLRSRQYVPWIYWLTVVLV